MARPATQKIDGFISRVRQRLIISFILLPTVAFLVFLLLAIFFAEPMLDRLRIPLEVGWSVRSLLFLLPILLLSYAFWASRRFSFQYTCRFLDDHFSSYHHESKTFFATYYKGILQPFPQWHFYVKELSDRMEDKALYNPSRIVPLWQWLLFFRILGSILLLWLLSMVMALSPVGLVPGNGQARGPGNGPNELEQQAEDAQQEAKSKSTRSLAQKLKDQARKMQGENKTPEEIEQELEKQLAEIEEHQQQLDENGQLESVLDRAANRLAEFQPTQEAGKTLYRREIASTKEELLDLQKKPEAKGESAHALRSASEILKEVESVEEVGRQMDQLARTLEEERQFSEKEQQAFEKAFDELQERLEDIAVTEKMKEAIEKEQQKREQADAADKKLEETKEKLMEDLDEMAKQAEQSQNEEMKDMGDQIKMLQKQVQRGVVSAEEAQEQMQQMEDQLQEMAEQSDDQQGKGEAGQMLRQMQESQQDFETGLLEHNNLVQERGRLDGPLDFEDFNLENESDSTGQQTQASNQEIRKVNKRQIEDSRVSRPQNTKQDQELLKRLYEQRKN